MNSKEEFWESWSFRRSRQGAVEGSGVVMVEVRRDVPLVRVRAGRWCAKSEVLPIRVPEANMFANLDC